MMGGIFTNMIQYAILIHIMIILQGMLFYKPTSINHQTQINQTDKRLMQVTPQELALFLEQGSQDDGGIRSDIAEDGDSQERFKLGQLIYLPTILKWIDSSIALITNVRRLHHCFFEDVRIAIKAFWDSDILVSNLRQLLFIDKGLFRLEWTKNPLLSYEYDLMFMCPINPDPPLVRLTKFRSKLKLYLRTVELEELAKMGRKKQRYNDWDRGFDPSNCRIPYANLPPFKIKPFLDPSLSLLRQPYMGREPEFDYLLRDLHPPIHSIVMSSEGKQLLNAHILIDQVLLFLTENRLKCSWQEIRQGLQLCWEVEVNEWDIKKINQIYPDLYQEVSYGNGRKSIVMPRQNRDRRNELFWRKLILAYKQEQFPYRK